MTGRMLDETLGKIHFWLTFIGFHTTFLVQHWLGNAGMPRRYVDYLPTDGFDTLNAISSIGAFIRGLSTLPFLWNVFKSYRYGRVVTVDDPWGFGNSLEWATSCPPPRHNFTELPRIRSERPAFELHYPEYIERFRTEARVGGRSSPYEVAVQGAASRDSAEREPEVTLSTAIHEPTVLSYRRFGRLRVPLGVGGRLTASVLRASRIIWWVKPHSLSYHAIVEVDDRDVPTGIGAHTAIPSNRPASSGTARVVPCAAPVEVGTKVGCTGPRAVRRPAFGTSHRLLLAFVGAQQLAKHVGQDPAVAVVGRFGRGVDPHGCRELGRREPGCREPGCRELG